MCKNISRCLTYKILCLKCYLTLVGVKFNSARFNYEFPYPFFVCWLVLFLTDNEIRLNDEISNDASYVTQL